MVKILIPTKPDDGHALFVKLALDQLGHQADLWFTADFPASQTHSFVINQKYFCWQSFGIDFIMDNPDYDLVWNRRPAKPVMPDILHPDDIQNAMKENQMFYQSLWQVILPGAKWINLPNDALRANAKALQLRIAMETGLKIPATLISNDPAKIKAFIKQYNKKVIYKSLYPVAWFESDGLRLTYTSAISLSDLPLDPVLRASPGIFQERIDKAYELRVTYFGDHYVAVKINSQKHDKAKMDWRAAPGHELELEEVELPDAIDSKCRALMKKLNLIFGCLDLIVSCDKEYYFLEINEQGQFLWIEEINPKIQMLRSFVSFVTGEIAGITLADFKHKVEPLRAKNQSLHQDPARIYRHASASRSGFV